MEPIRYYYINREDKVIQVYTDRVDTPEGFIFCGLSQLPLKAAAGYYAKNEPGYDIQDLTVQQEQTNDASQLREDSGISGDPEEGEPGDPA